MKKDQNGWIRYSFWDYVGLLFEFRSIGEIEKHFFMEMSKKEKVDLNTLRDSYHTHLLNNFKDSDEKYYLWNREMRKICFERNKETLRNWGVIFGLVAIGINIMVNIFFKQ